MAALADYLFSESADEVREALRSTSGPLLADLGGAADAALGGSVQGVRLYVTTYRALTRSMLDALGAEGEALDVAVFPDYRSRALGAVLENASAEAPFTPWAVLYPLGDAVGLELTNRLRLLAGVPALTPPHGERRRQLDDEQVDRFLRRVRHLLNTPEGEEDLERIMRVLGLSKTELAGLFGVRRQAVDGWLAHGVPADRRDAIATIVALVELLERKLKRDRVPGIARRPAPDYGGRTMLEMIAAGRHHELLDSVRASFDWARAA